MVSHSAKDSRCRPNCWIPHEILATEKLLLANFCLLWQEQPSSGDQLPRAFHLSGWEAGLHGSATLVAILTAWGTFPVSHFNSFENVCFPLSVFGLAPTLSPFLIVDRAAGASAHLFSFQSHVHNFPGSTQPHRFLKSLLFLQHSCALACRLLYGSTGQSMKALH